MEEALDQLSFTDDKELFNLMELSLEEETDAQGAFSLSDDEDGEDGWEGRGYDPQEWNAYTSDDDSGLDLEDEDDLDDDGFDDDDLL